MRQASRALVVVVAIAVALAVVPAGAGAITSTKSKPAPYAAKVCGSLATWVDKIDAAAATASDTAPATPEAGKQALVKLMSSSIGATKKLVAQLKAAGPPAVKGGGAVASTVLSQFKQVIRTFTSVRSSLKKVPSDGPGFVAASRAAQDSLESGLEHVQAAFNAATTIDVPPLVAAFNANATCQQLTA